jgi:hypothetical protein
MHDIIDSDRFAWRRHLTLDNQIELSAYSYDQGVKPYPDNPTVSSIHYPHHHHMSLTHLFTHSFTR